MTVTIYLFNSTVGTGQVKEKWTPKAQNYLLLVVTQHRESFHLTEELLWQMEPKVMN